MQCGLMTGQSWITVSQSHRARGRSAPLGERDFCVAFSREDSRVELACDGYDKVASERILEDIA